MEQILFYTTDGGKAKQVEDLCLSLGLAFRRLTVGDIRYAVASVVSGDYKLPLGGPASVPLSYVQPELLLFSGLKDKTLDRFLKRFRAEGIAPVPLKAVVTPFNCTWTLYELTQQLQRERAVLGK